MATPILRPARPTDAAEMLDLMAITLAHESACGGIAHSFADREREIAWLRYLMQSETAWVVEAEKHMAGFGIAAQRGPIRWLVSLFVRPEAQGHGLGRLLLEQLWPAEAAQRATLVDAVSRAATSLYLHAGLLPRLPVLSWEGELESLTRRSPSIRLEEDRAAVAPRVAAADQQAFGTPRETDHAHWTAHGYAFRSLWDERGDWLGYARWSPAGRLGPVVLKDHAVWADALASLTGAMADTGLTRVQVMVPAANRPALLACRAEGWHYQGMEITMATCALDSWEHCLIHRAGLP